MASCAIALLLFGNLFIRIIEVEKHIVELLIIGEYGYNVGEEIGDLLLFNLAIIDQGTKGAASFADTSAVIKPLNILFGLSGSSEINKLPIQIRVLIRCLLPFCESMIQLPSLQAACVVLFG